MAGTSNENLALSLRQLHYYGKLSCASQDLPGERTVVLAGDAGSVWPAGPVEDDLLVGRTGLGEDRVVVGGVEITPDVGEAGGDVVVLQLVL